MTQDMLGSGEVLCCTIRLLAASLRRTLLWARLHALAQHTALGRALGMGTGTDRTYM
jgi:hypothetical protein